MYQFKIKKFLLISIILIQLYNLGLRKIKYILLFKQWFYVCGIAHLDNFEPAKGYSDYGA